MNNRIVNNYFMLEHDLVQSNSYQSALSLILINLSFTFQINGFIVEDMPINLAESFIRGIDSVRLTIASNNSNKNANNHIKSSSSMVSSKSTPNGKSN